ncbi:MAG TPA: DUF4177 domain-containing protein [Verrucomicrobiae bacterium]|nr:DUF4177 domain-containing protein [Verrucomicrobiae bacterium]
MAAGNHFEFKLRQLDYHGDPKSLINDEHILNASGGDGWELVSAVPIVENGKTVRILYCLKKHSRHSLI